MALLELDTILEEIVYTGKQIVEIAIILEEIVLALIEVGTILEEIILATSIYFF